VVEPSGSCLVAASPGEPSGGVTSGFPEGESGCEQAFYLRGGERDHPRVGRRGLVRRQGRRGLGIGAVPELGGGDGADRQGGHDQHDVTLDRGVKPGLALIQAEAVLPEPEIFFSRPPLIPVKKKSSLAFRMHPGRY
jgi:hypothetical protein